MSENSGSSQPTGNEADQSSQSSQSITSNQSNPPTANDPGGSGLNPTVRRQSFRVETPPNKTDEAQKAVAVSSGADADKDQDDRPSLVEGSVQWQEVRKGTRPGDRYIRFSRPQPEQTRLKGRGEEAQVIAWDAESRLNRYIRTKRFLLGSPIATARAAHERLGKIQALAVLSSDALSSVAYATESALFVLVIGVSKDRPEQFIIPISLAISLLIAIVVWSYRQTIHAYPNGGGSYIVAKDNLGIHAGLLAAGALMIDYVLTVSVSVAAGVQNFVSAVPSLADSQLIISIGLVILLVVVNLRGVRDSGVVFAIPTYFFILSFLVMIGVGAFQIITGTPHPAIPLPVGKETIPDDYNTQAITLILILQAFASGCSALTGVEAISNGVPAFQKPEAKNAATTLIWMGLLLIIFFMGISFLADQLVVHPNKTDTTISQLSRTVFGDSSIGYYIVQAATALILILAANTSFADFPRLASLLSKDKFLPHIFAHRGDRLAFSTGIIALGGLAILLLLIFGSNTQALIPLYAVGVFLAFTLSQSGMVIHWQKLKRRGGEGAKGATRSQFINGLGAVSTGVVLVVIAGSKFLAGAWLVVILIPLLYILFRVINGHYVRVEKQLKLEGPASLVSTLPSSLSLSSEQTYQIIVPVSNLNVVTLSTLRFARVLGSNVTAVHVTDDSEAILNLKSEWEAARLEVPLVILESPYRSIVRPLLTYVDTIHERAQDDVLIIMLPEFVARHWWENVLHNQTALRLKAALLYRPRVVVMSVPYQLR